MWIAFVLPDGEVFELPVNRITDKWTRPYERFLTIINKVDKVSEKDETYTHYLITYREIA